jgi:hypothetical protein
LNAQRAGGAGEGAIVRRRPYRGIRRKRPREHILSFNDGSRVRIDFLGCGQTSQHDKKDAPRQWRENWPRHSHDLWMQAFDHFEHSGPILRKNAGKGNDWLFLWFNLGQSSFSGLTGFDPV